MPFRSIRRTRWLAVTAAVMLPAVGLANDVDRVTEGGLRWLATSQSRLGSWDAGGRYPAAMTALAGIALLAEGSTPSGGRYAPEIRLAVDYLLAQARPNGLIGDPLRDDRYTYGHGFGMLFLSQVLGEEEDARRREELIRVLTAAVQFTGQAQTAAGGWGYVSARDGNGFDEGSTTVTQVQGLRGCRNAGIPVPKGIIDGAVGYIHGCTQADGGVQYSTKGGNGRPAITAAALACLYEAGSYDDNFVPRMKEYCQLRLAGDDSGSHGHWHYANFYYSQVQYREAGDTWDDYRRATYGKLVADATPVETPLGPGYRWNQGYIGPVYTTALNLIMLQLDEGCLPIYQR
ncbi:hypothetical protein Pla108_31850 [Botrimarina colliarenosi]|uniref:Prenyltransferase and squalene oxidase repeat protein n=1 Tax=Botrimarina colliarenosi TaxID=2528001 RepID=A0A5C6ACY9_9BACT|nr:prenyltransferase/squalene oxidase repeat-containing protein [Botrimarina colliarenosi]TWT96103.1 hypothetical protein Pla108_31850 [Botrimarina colliarenosi]